MIVGPSDDVVAVTFEPSEGPDDLLAKYAAAVEASSSQEYLILVDLFGGSPYNAAARFAAGRDDATSGQDLDDHGRLTPVTDVRRRRVLRRNGRQRYRLRRRGHEDEGAA